MATHTPNYNLRKPATTDTVNVTLDIGANMDIIDSALDAKAEEAHTHVGLAPGVHSHSDFTDHAADSTGVHGIADTAALATTSAMTTALEAHRVDTTDVHGIANTAVLATATTVSDAVATHTADSTAVHGIADTTLLITAAAHALIDHDDIPGAGQIPVQTSAPASPDLHDLWVDEDEPALSGGGGATILQQDAAPASPAEDDLWIDTDATPSGSSVPVVTGARTSGNVTLNGVGWGNVDTGLDLTIPAVVGDWIEVSLSGRLAAGAANTHTFFDVAFVAGGSVTNHFSLGGTGGGGDEGLNGLRIKDTDDSPLTGTFLRQTEAADVSGGNVIVRLRYRQDTAGNRLFVAGATNPFKWWVKNLG